MVNWGGAEYLYFAGTNYLGVSARAEVRAFTEEGMARYGCHVSVSRAANIGFPIFAQADAKVAQWLGVEAALLFSSGFTACQILLKSLMEAGHEILYTPGVHPANWRNYRDKTSLPWQHLLRKVDEAKHPVAIFCKSVDPIHLRPVGFDWIRDIPKDKPCVIVVDDSHTMGVWGDQAEGMHRALRSLAGGRDLVIVGSLGKGLGMPAGVVGGRRHWIESVEQTPYYAGASMPNPAFVHALLRGLPRLTEWQQALQKNIGQFEQYLAAKKRKKYFSALPYFPIFRCKSEGIFEHLKKEKILIAKFRYPSREDDLVSRIVLNGAHTQEDIHTLSRALDAFYDP